jgi:dephospho-CoA kinase
MRIIGLTGSIGMGKSTAAAMLRRLGVPVHDADATVHALFAKGGLAVAPVARAFPDAVKSDQVDRAVLGKLVFGDDAALKRLEAIVHPLVKAQERRFLQMHRRRHTDLVVLDIPLLLEGKRRRNLDCIVVVSAPAFLQAQRVLARPGMTQSRLAAIRAKQMPDPQKRRLADIVVPTGTGKGPAFQKLKALVARFRREQRHA